MHNEEGVGDLERKGVQVIHSTDELKGRPKGGNRDHKITWCGEKKSMMRSRHWDLRS